MTRERTPRESPTPDAADPGQDFKHRIRRPMMLSPQRTFREVQEDAIQTNSAGELARAAERSIRGSARRQGADFVGLPLDTRHRYLVVWSGRAGRRNQLVLRSRGPVEAAATFAASHGCLHPHFCGRSGDVLYCRSDGHPEALCYYVLPASTPVARAVSRYLMRTRNLRPRTHGGFTVRPALFLQGARSAVVERRPAMEVQGRPYTYEHRTVVTTDDTEFAQRVAEILNADLRLSGEKAR